MLAPLCVVKLPITIVFAPFENMMIIDFVVVDEESSYQMILGRSFLKVSKAVISNHYLALKYRVNGVVGVVRGDQRIVRGCYSTIEKEAMQITSLDARAKLRRGRQKLVEELETGNLEQGGSGGTIKIGLKLKKELKRELVHCLQTHSDVFAWMHDEMAGIDPEIACHRLAIKNGA